MGDWRGEAGGQGIADKRKRGEGKNLLGDRFQDKGSARAETRGLSGSEQQPEAGSEGGHVNRRMNFFLCLKAIR